MPKNKSRRSSLANQPTSDQQQTHTPLEKQGQLDQQVVAMLRREMVHQGPLPSAEQMAQYDAVVPGMPQKLLEEFVELGKHQRAMQKQESDRYDRLVDGQLSMAVRGQRFGLTVVLLLVGASIWLALTGHDAAACVLGGTTIVGVTSVFVTGYIKKKALPPPPSDE